MYYPRPNDDLHREQQRADARFHARQADERFVDRSRILIAAQEAKREGFTHFAEALEKLSKNNQMEDDKNEA